MPQTYAYFYAIAYINCTVQVICTQYFFSGKDWVNLLKRNLHAYRTLIGKLRKQKKIGNIISNQISFQASSVKRCCFWRKSWEYLGKLHNITICFNNHYQEQLRDHSYPPKMTPFSMCFITLYIWSTQMLQFSEKC